MNSQAARRGLNGARPSDLATDRAPTARQEHGLQWVLELARALASENEELVEELRAARERILTANERERRRIERDLHDGAQQSLLVIRLKLAGASEQVDDENLAAKLDEIAADADAASQILHRGDADARVAGLFGCTMGRPLGWGAAREESEVAG